MDNTLLMFSLVIVGKEYNPSLLNPDFLNINKIVPREWGWELVGGQIITTPPLAKVQYTNGVEILVEPSKLQIRHVEPEGDPTTSEIAKIAQKYIEVLPHVRYAALGTNFQSAIEINDPSVFLKDRLIKPGPWDNDTNPVNSVGMKFVYPLTNGRIILSLDSGRIVKETNGEEEKREVVIADVNFHRGCNEKYPATDLLKDYLDEIENDWETFRKLLHNAIGVGDA